MTTKLRLLLDEDVGGPLAREIQEFSGLLNVLYVCDVPELRGTKDPDLLGYANKENYVLLTVDAGFNHNDCPPCTHKGIIRITTRNKHEAIHGEVLKRFFQSGHRAEVKNAVAYVSDGKAVIHTHTDTITHSF